MVSIEGHVLWNGKRIILHPSLCNEKLIAVEGSGVSGVSAMWRTRMQSSHDTPTSPHAPSGRAPGYSAYRRSVRLDSLALAFGRIVGRCLGKMDEMVVLRYEGANPTN